MSRELAVSLIREIHTNILDPRGHALVTLARYSTLGVGGPRILGSGHQAFNIPAGAQRRAKIHRKRICDRQGWGGCERPPVSSGSLTRNTSQDLQQPEGLQRAPEVGSTLCSRRGRIAWRFACHAHLHIPRRTYRQDGPTTTPEDWWKWAATPWGLPRPT